MSDTDVTHGHRRAASGSGGEEPASSSAGRVSARRFIDALYQLENHGDVDTIASLYADDAEVSNPTDTSPHRGRDGAREFWSKYRQSFERVHSEFRNVVETDAVALLEWRSEGRTAAGEDFAYDGVSVVEFPRGQIRRFRAYFDPHALSGGAAKREAARELTPARRSD